ncbi:unnamed protein product, partial [Mesorhabditis belari]|uniref:Protein kinase domain-containing protein n=1 Tax=Mesorhabditis belari TaxID=2138241 RepID=A0AAF3ENG1_9BILA
MYEEEVWTIIDGGSSGIIHLVEANNRKTVVKSNANEISRKNIEREKEIMMRISHDNIVAYIGTRDIVMGIPGFGIELEYCERRSLKRVVLGSSISYSIKTVLCWAEQLFEVLEYLDQRSIVHGDIKLENIFVKENFDLKVGDFGSTRDCEVTCSGTFHGTHRYISPDLITENMCTDRKISRANDVYAVGLVLWETLERSRVYAKYDSKDNFNTTQFFIDILFRVLQKLEPPTCIEELQKIIVSCSSFDRGSRPKPQDVLKAVKHILEENALVKGYEFLPIIDEKQRVLLPPFGSGRSLDDEKSSSFLVPDGEDLRSMIDPMTEEVPESNDSPRQEFHIHRALNTNSNLRRFNRIEDVGRLTTIFNEMSSENQIKFYQILPRMITEAQQKVYFFHEHLALTTRFMDLAQSTDPVELFEALLLADFAWEAEEMSSYFQELTKDTRFSLFWIESTNMASKIRVFAAGKTSFYLTRFYFECYFSTVLKEEWLLVEGHDNIQEIVLMVTKDLSKAQYLKGHWHRGKTFIAKDCQSDVHVSYGVITFTSHADQLHFTGNYPIDPYMMLEAFTREREKLLNQAVIIRNKMRRLNEIRSIPKFLDIGSKLPIPSYIFQLRNPPRIPCRHKGICSKKQWPKDTFTERVNISGSFPPKLFIDYFECTTKEELQYLSNFFVVWNDLGTALEQFSSYLNKSQRILMYAENFSFEKNNYFPTLFVPNFQEEKGHLVLLDHPVNYENFETIPAFSVRFAQNIDLLIGKIHELPVRQLRRYLRDLPVEKHKFLLIDPEKEPKESPRPSKFCLVDHEGKQIFLSRILFRGKTE